MTTRTIEHIQEDLDLAYARIDKAIEFIEENSDESPVVLEQITNILLHWYPNIEWSDELDEEVEED